MNSESKPMPWPDSALRLRLGVEHPIILAPMAGATNAKLVAAVSNAGGLGSYGAASTPPARLREVIRQIRQLTTRPFHVNLFSEPFSQNRESLEVAPAMREKLEQFGRSLGIDSLPEPSLAFQPSDAQLDVLIEEQVPVISFHFGAHQQQIDRARESGALVLCSATSAEEAKLLEQSGIDVIIAQGAEAGGHRGSFGVHEELPMIGTMALVPQVVGAVSVPVIAAGGIMDGRGIVAALALGAQAVQLGTAFLCCDETPISSAWKQSLHDADGSDTVITSAFSGRPARGLRNRFIDEIEALDAPLLPYPAQYSLSEELRAEAASQGIADFIAMWCGQGTGMIRQGTAAQLVATLVSEAEDVRRKLMSS